MLSCIFFISDHVLIMRNKYIVYLAKFLFYVVVKQGPWYHWYHGDARYTPNGRPHQMKTMTHNSVPKAGFASQTRVNASIKLNLLIKLWAP